MIDKWSSSTRPTNTVRSSSSSSPAVMEAPTLGPPPPPGHRSRHHRPHLPAPGAAVPVPSSIPLDALRSEQRRGREEGLGELALACTARAGRCSDWRAPPHADAVSAEVSTPLPCPQELAPRLMKLLLLLERELNPPLVDAAIDVESEHSNRSADTSPEVAKQSTSRRSRILDWLEELSMPRTKNVCGGARGGCGGIAGKRRMRGRRSSEEERRHI
jgi:hypothetical protein